MERCALGTTGIKISRVALGCWPIAGMASPGVNDDDSLATIRACFELGINHLDTAYCYGRSGESERLIARALGTRRDEMVIATKGGIHWEPDGRAGRDASPGGANDLFDKAIPLLALGALAQPLGGLVAAALAYVHTLGLFAGRNTGHAYRVARDYDTVELPARSEQFRARSEA